MRIDDNTDWRTALPGHPSASRALVVLDPPAPSDRKTTPSQEAADVGLQKAAPAKAAGLDVRSFTPRQMVEASMDMYVSGVLDWDEYALLAFQPELHPDYDRTIGALTGDKAEPDRPRDFIAQWESRLEFDTKHNADKPDIVARTGRIVAVLKQLGAEPTDFRA